MRHRRGQSAGVSLFAFQDIMASVIGVLFFVVLLMSLSITKRAKAAPEVPEAEKINKDDVQAKRGELAALEADIRKLEEEIEKLKEKLAKRFGGNIGEKQEELGNLKNQGHQLGRNVEKYKKLIANAEKDQADTEEAKRKKKEERERLRGQIAALDGKIANLEKKIKKYPPRKPGDDLHGDAKDDAFRVEITRRTLCVGTRRRGLLKKFTGSSDSDRRKRLLSWARTAAKTKKHFVLYIKPSGIDAFPEVFKALHAAGYQIGYDLLPESKSPF